LLRLLRLIRLLPVFLRHPSLPAFLLRPLLRLDLPLPLLRLDLPLPLLRLDLPLPLLLASPQPPLLLAFLALLVLRSPQASLPDLPLRSLLSLPAFLPLPLLPAFLPLRSHLSLRALLRVLAGHLHPTSHRTFQRS